jgi:quercetin dioxygenase-like cupin family protein
MSVDHSHHIEEPNATTSAPQIEVVGSVSTPPVPDPSEAMTVLVTLPPGSAGSPPHRHSGPAFGYVLEERRSRRAPRP